MAGVYEYVEAKGAGTGCGPRRMSRQHRRHCKRAFECGESAFKCGKAMWKGRDNIMTAAFERLPLSYATGSETTQTEGAKPPPSSTRGSSVGVQLTTEFAERRTAVPPSRIALADKLVLLVLVALVAGWTLAVGGLVYRLFTRV